MTETRGMRGPAPLPRVRIGQVSFNRKGSMRVLHISSGGLFGGVETFLIQLARSSAQGAAIESHFALTEEGRLSEELRAAGASVHMLGTARVRNPLQVRRAAKRLRALLRVEGFDAAVCHSPWAHALFARSVRAAGVPLVFYLHNDVTGRHWLERLARRVPPDLVVTNSHFTGSTAGKLFPGVRCELVRYPVPVPRESRDPEARAATRAELGADATDVVIIQTSRMEAWKGHRLHLEALGLLAAHPGWRCWIVGGVQRPGERRYLEELQGMVDRAGIGDRVRFVGQRSDVPRLLAAADIHCQPNLGPEPFGIVFVEAMYAALPVVTTDLGGPREIIDGSCGVLTPPGDAPALAAALGDLIDDPARRRALGSGGPARAAALCDPERQVQRLADVLATVHRAPVGTGV